MNTYRLNHNEYVKLIRHCSDINDYHPGEGPLNVLLDLTRVNFDFANLYFEVPKELMRRIAIMSLCDMALIQYRDTRGEIDYAFLGDYSEPVLNSILNIIDDI